MNLAKRTPRILRFSPYRSSGTCDALVVLASSSPGNSLNAEPKTYLLQPQMLEALSHLNVQAFIGAVKTYRDTVSSEENLGAAIDQALNSESTPLVSQSNIQFLVDREAFTDYDSVKQFFLKITESKVLSPEVIYYLILTKISVGAGNVSPDTVARYINESATPQEVKAISWAYLTRYQCEPTFDPFNKLLSALLSKAGPDAGDVIQILKNKHAFPH